jgi:YegS/Rv2252/BmrU family lipid kinase
MTNISFIINPISGYGKKKTIEKHIESYLEPRFNVEILYTQAAKHAIELSSKASLRSDIVVAVGGDGSIHEVAQALVGTDTKMGIIPMGSGNGLARHLNIPLDVKKAIDLINTDYSEAVDVMAIGDIYSINVSGIGYDAHIANEFASYGKRGFSSYIKLTLKEYFKYKASTYQLNIDGNDIEQKAFLISFANSSQFGNNAYIAPQADIQDGIFELVVLRPFSKINAANIGLKLFTKKIDQSKFIDIYEAKQVKVSSSDSFPLHIDGENMGLKKELNIKIKPSCLNIILPKPLI